MTDSLKENAIHGNRAFPFALYHMHRMTQPFAASLHWHEELELIYVQQGRLNLTIDKANYLGLPGDIFVVNSREIHEMSVTQTPTIYATVLFPLESLLFQQGDEVTEKYLLPLAENRLRFPSAAGELAIAPELRQKMEEMIALYHEKKGAYMLKIRVLELGIISDFFSQEGLLVPSNASRFQDKHRQILRFVQENCYRELTLETAAQEFHMAPKYFSRYFKNTFHIPLTEYVNRLRLEMAADLLRHSDLPITEIAMQTGFNSSSYFNKQFRTAYEMTPTQYREKK